MNIRNLLKVALLGILIPALSANAALPYKVKFAGTGDATTVESVKVENLTRGTSLNLKGDETLLLVEKLSGVGIEDLSSPKPLLKLFPNPAKTVSELSFSIPTAGKTQITVYDLMGKQMMQAIENLDAGEHSFQLSALPYGIYMVTVKAPHYSASEKWICQGNGSQGGISLTSSSASNAAASMSAPAYRVSQAHFATEAAEREMRYEDGDMLRFTAKSGNCTTILMKRVTNSLNIEFQFVKCTDANGKHYPIVKIGDLFWMAEDLQAADGLTLAKSKTEWAAISANTPGMAYLNFDESKKSETAFYNRAGAEKALPDGWRLPAAGEVQTMVKQLERIGNASELLKARHDDSWTNPVQSVDETSFGAKAYGRLLAVGSFANQGKTASYWAKNTMSDVGYAFEVGGSNAKLISNSTTSSLKAGYAVRGVVDAQNAYSKIISEFEKNHSGNSSASETPILGNNFLMTEEYKDEIVYQPSFMTTQEKFPLLHKGVAQLTASGNEIPVMVCYENGTLTFRTYNGTSKTAEKQIALATSTDHIKNETYSPRNLSIAGSTIEHPQTGNRYNIAENYSVRKEWDGYWDMQVVSKDFTGDGIGDFAVCVYNKVAIVDGASFALIAEKAYTIPQSGFVLQIAMGDVLGAGSDNLVVINGETMDVYTDPLKLAAKADYSVDCRRAINEGKNNISNIAIGDVKGTGSNQIVVGQKAIYNYIALFEYNKENDAIELTLKNRFSDGGYDYNTENAQMFEMGLPRFRGRAFPCDIVMGPHFFRYDSETGKLHGLSFPYASSPELDYPLYLGAIINISNSMYCDQITRGTDMVVGNFDKNEEGREQIKFLSTYWYTNMFSSSYNSSGVSLITIGYSPEANRLEGTLSKLSESKGYSNVEPSKLPALNKEFQLIGANVSGRSRVLSYKGYQLTFSEPRIHALMAAPPYYDDYDYRWDMGTSWGKSSMTGTEQENATSVSGSVIVGYEQDFNIPIVGTKVGGIDFTTKIKMGTTKTRTETETITKSNTYTLWYDDCVVLTVIPYDSYTYTIEKSFNKEEEGTDIIVAAPGKAMSMMITLDDYEKLTSNESSVPNLRSLFKHTPGDPTSYPRNKSEIKSNAAKPFVHFGASAHGSDFANIGSGGNQARQISVDKTMANSTSFDFETEIELVATAFGVKVGGAFGYDNSNTSTTMVGEGHTIAGIVAGLDKVGDRPEFRWDVAWFNYTLNGQTFSVIQYVVQP